MKPTAQNSFPDPAPYSRPLKKPTYSALFLCIAAGLFVLFAAAGCDDAKKLANDTKEGYRELESIVDQLVELKSSLTTNDLNKAKEIAATIDHHLDTRVLSWHVKLLYIEEKDSIDAVYKTIEELRDSDDVTDSELTALADIEAWFQSKGDHKTLDIVVMIGAIAMESKFPHQGAIAVALLNQRLRPDEGPWIDSRDDDRPPDVEEALLRLTAPPKEKTASSPGFVDKQASDPVSADSQTDSTGKAGGSNR